MSSFAIQSAVVVLKSPKKIKPQKNKKAFKQLTGRIKRARNSAEINLAPADSTKGIKDALRDNKTFGVGDQVILQTTASEGGAKQLLRAERTHKGKIRVKKIAPSDIQGKPYVAADGTLQKAQTSHTLAETLRVDGKFGVLGKVRTALNDVKDKFGEGGPIKEALEKVNDLIKRHIKGRRVKAKHIGKLKDKVGDLQKKPKDAEGAFKTLETLQETLKTWA
ncbi:MAG: hypothetical protein IPK79_06350 [Vampirovibrionales bacterium]|nr:hypothetical protein [Vampirovibrionales bacterium]